MRSTPGGHIREDDLRFAVRMMSRTGCATRSVAVFGWRVRLEKLTVGYDRMCFPGIGDRRQVDWWERGKCMSGQRNGRNRSL